MTPCRRRHAERRHGACHNDFADAFRTGDPGKSYRFLTHLDPATATPLPLTAIGVAAILALALAVQMAGLADLTFRFTLVVFATINVSLICITSREMRPPAQVFVCPLWVPFAGLASSVGLLFLDKMVP